MFLAGIALLTPLGLAGAARVRDRPRAASRPRCSCASGIVLHRLRLGQRDVAARPRPAPAGHRRGVHRWPPSGWPTCRRSPPSSARAGSRTARPRAWPGSRRPHRSAASWSAAPCCGWPGGVFYGLGDPPGEDPQMAAEAAEETSETDAGQAADAADDDRPARRPGGRRRRRGPGAAARRRRCRRPRSGSRTRPAYNADRADRRARHAPGGRCTPPGPPASPSRPSSPALGSVAGALVLAWLALYWRRLPLLRRGYEPAPALPRPLRRFQSGVVNDYVTWIVIGLACLGGVLALVIR